MKSWTCYIHHRYWFTIASEFAIVALKNLNFTACQRSTTIGRKKSLPYSGPHTEEVISDRVLRSAGATRVPINLVALMSFA